VMRAISHYHRHGLLLIRSIMQKNLARSVSPTQAPVLPSDKRPRSTSPEVTAQAATRSTAPKRRKKPKRTPPESGSPQDVISREVVGLLGSELVARAEADGLDWESPFGFREEVELTVSSISSSGT
jgi:tRNA (uracil-5-)-methyltransferase